MKKENEIAVTELLDVWNTLYDEMRVRTHKDLEMQNGYTQCTASGINLAMDIIDKKIRALRCE